MGEIDPSEMFMFALPPLRCRYHIYAHIHLTLVGQTGLSYFVCLLRRTGAFFFFFFFFFLSPPLLLPSYTTILFLSSHGFMMENSTSCIRLLCTKEAGFDFGKSFLFQMSRKVSGKEKTKKEAWIR